MNNPTKTGASLRATRSGLQIDAVFRTAGRGRNAPAPTGRIRLTVGALAALMVRWFRVTNHRNLIRSHVSAGSDTKALRKADRAFARRHRAEDGWRRSPVVSRPSTGGTHHG